MIIKINKPRFRTKAIFIDYDWTIVKPKNNATFPKNLDDWEWLRPCVPDIIKQYYDKGYGIYIVTNQSKDWKVNQIENVIKLLNIPVTVCISRNKIEYKPSLFLYHEAVTKQINLEKSFMCGDALGRTNDYSDVDLKFAEAIGIKCLSPEDFFSFEEQKLAVVKALTMQEIIIMVGYPASGKTTISNTVFETAGYVIMHGDELKTSIKMIKTAVKPITDGKSVVFDATNATKEKRSEYIEFAKKHNVPVRCVYVSTSMEESLQRNNNREKPVPRIVYNIYNKKFQMPTVEEGCEVVKV